MPFDQHFPKISSSTYIAPNATLIGNISMGERTSIWFGAMLRAESSSILIENDSNVQDNCVIHTDENFPVKIGAAVSIGHGAIIHGASVGSNCLVGMGAILLNGSSVGENSLVGAGALLTQGTQMPGGMLIVGSPAVAKRKLKAEEIEKIRQNSENYNKFRVQYLKSSV
jgi:carbonic anhydrase/acetyltransferase-like protein (isoleucine patch superfamily)